MIIKANSRKGGRKLGGYLLTENDQQQAIVLDQRGTLMDDLRSIFSAWEKEAMAVTKAEKPLYHMQIRLAPGETLTDQQWFHTLDVVEKKLKLTDHPRVVVAHYMDGEPHLHVVYSRLNRERGTLLRMSHDRRHHHATCRQLEKEFDLRQLESAPKRERNGNQRTRSIEHKMTKESGVTREELCRMVEDAWNTSNTGRQFQLRLEQYGFTMTPGERRDYNIWYNDKRYDPVRLLEYVRTAEFRAKMRRDPPIFEERAQEKTKLLAPARRQAKDIQHDEFARACDLPATRMPPSENQRLQTDKVAYVPRISAFLTQPEIAKCLSSREQLHTEAGVPTRRQANNIRHEEAEQRINVGNIPQQEKESWEEQVKRRRKETEPSVPQSPQDVLQMPKRQKSEYQLTLELGE